MGSALRYKLGARKYAQRISSMAPQSSTTQCHTDPDATATVQWRHRASRTHHPACICSSGTKVPASSNDHEFLRARLGGFFLRPWIFHFPGHVREQTILFQN